MQQVPILETILQIPPMQPGLVSHPRPIERRDTGADRTQTLIPTPAGCAQTTAVSEWVDSLRSGDDGQIHTKQEIAHELRGKKWYHVAGNTPYVP